MPLFLFFTLKKVKALFSLCSYILEEIPSHRRHKIEKPDPILVAVFGVGVTITTCRLCTQRSICWCSLCWWRVTTSNKVFSWSRPARDGLSMGILSLEIKHWSYGKCLPHRWTAQENNFQGIYANFLTRLHALNQNLTLEFLLFPGLPTYQVPSLGHDYPYDCQYIQTCTSTWPPITPPPIYHLPKS